MGREGGERLDEDDGWKLTYEKVEPHPMCCDECKASREETRRLREGLEAIRDEAQLHSETIAREVCNAVDQLLASPDREAK